ncbi:MAG: SH3 domain-containing protein [Actinomycetota bacterium]
MTDPPFTATHTAPAEGMDAWRAPDPSQAPDNRLDPELPVSVVEETTGWARVRCSNGWETWVDASKLVAVPPVAPVTPGAFAPTHTVPATGLETRDQPDFAQPPTNRLDPGLPVEIANRWGDWAKVRCSNG